MSNKKESLNKEVKIRKVRPIHPSAVASTLHPALQSAVKNMNHRDMQRKCILLGMKPRHVIGTDHWQLLSFMDNNWGKIEDKEKLIKFDHWLDRKLQRLGKESIAPSLRMSYIRDENLEEASAKPIIKKKTTPKVIKSKRVKTDYGIVEGTKKHFVYELVKKGKDTKDIIKKTVKKYPECKENSIKIWVSKAKKLFKD